VTAPEPDPILGQLDLIGDEAALAAEDAALRRELDRITALRAEHTTRALDRVAAAAHAADAAGTELDRAVAEARGRGASWTDIGKAAGMARQSAWKRWHSPDEDQP